MARSDPPDSTLVGLAIVAAGLLVVGQVGAHVTGRGETTGQWLALNSLVALGPVVVAAVWLRRPDVAWLHRASVLAAVGGLVAAAIATERHPAAAALAIPAWIVLVACRPLRGIRVPASQLSVVLGAAIGVGLVVAPNGPGSEAVALASGRLDDGQGAIGLADARFLADTLGSSDRFPGARCYFVRAESGSAAYDDVVACGPVIHPRETEDQEEGATAVEEPPGPWDLYPVRVDDGEPRIGKPTVEQVVDTVLLQRPDGLRPPDVDTSNEEPSTVSPGFVAHLGDEAPDDATPASGFVLAGTGTVTARGVASSDVVLDERGIERLPPDGYRFAAVDLTFEDVEGVTLEVLSGDQRVDITPAVAPGGGSLVDGWVVTAVVDDGVDPLLDVTYRGRAQRLSLGTGERVGGDPLLYGPPAQTIGREVARFETDVLVPAPTPYAARVFVGSYDVVAAELNVFEPNRGWAPPGQAWLIVTIDDLGTPAFLDADIALDPDVILHFDPIRSFGLVGADGVPVAATAVGSGTEADLAVVFVVDETLRQATFHVAPTWRLVANDTLVDVATPLVDIPLDLG